MVSAGLLLFRRTPDLQVLLAHPGGPFWMNKDLGAWTIPKGALKRGEEHLAAAKREFSEETGLMPPQGDYISLGETIMRSKKVVHAWAVEGDADTGKLTSNMTTMQWPPRSGRRIVVPEIDRCEWFDVETAVDKINQAQVVFIRRLVLRLEVANSSPE